MLDGARAKRSRNRRSALVRDENRLDLRLDLLLGLPPRNRDLFHDERARRVEHPALTEAELLVSLQAIQISKNLCDIVDRASLDLVHKPTIPAIPRLVVERDSALAKEVENVS